MVQQTHVVTKGYRLRHLTVRYGQSVPAVNDVSFDMRGGEISALVGESGSGKTTLGRTLLGATSHVATVEQGTVEVVHPGGEHRAFDLSNDGVSEFIANTKIGYIPQDPLSSLSPLRAVGKQIRDVVLRSTTLTGSAAERRAVELIEAVGIADAQQRYRQFPHEFSGGMRQRILIAIALAGEPELIIADEPTSALDSTIRNQILELLTEIIRDRNIPLLLITHDLTEVLSRAATVTILHAGAVTDVFRPDDAQEKAQLSDYGAELFAAEEYRGFAAQHSVDSDVTAARLEKVTKRYAQGFRRGSLALQEVSLDIPQGSFFAVVGESGSGKTTLAKLLLGIESPTSGRVSVEGQGVQASTRKRSPESVRAIQMVYQDPFSSVDPRLTVREIVHEPLGVRVRQGESAPQVLQLFRDLALDPDFLERRASELSGGQLQRVAIVRALVLQPKIVVFDEALSALDPIIRAQTMQILLQLREQYSITFVYISHDLRLVSAVADFIAVFRGGELIETGSTNHILKHPTHEYTRDLVQASRLPYENFDVRS